MYIPVPDVVDRPSEELRRLLTSGRLPQKVSGALASQSLDNAIKDVRMTLREVFVFDNRDPGKGDIYLVTSVTDSISAGSFTLTVKTFEDIPDKAPLQIGPGGLAISRSPTDIKNVVEVHFHVKPRCQGGKHDKSCDAWFQSTSER